MACTFYIFPYAVVDLVEPSTTNMQSILINWYGNGMAYVALMINATMAILTLYPATTNIV